MKRLITVAVAFGVLAAGGNVPAKDLVQTADEAGRFTMLLKAIRQAGLEGKMTTPGPFTVFAPTDAAFQALPAATAERLMNPANKDELAKVLSYHVLAGRLMAADAAGKNVAASTLIGQPLVVNGEGDAVTVNGAKLIQSDVRADNGIVHVIDRVLIPPTPVQPRM